MNFGTKCVLVTGVILMVAAPASAQTAAHTDHHIYTPQAIRWTAGPPSLPRGSEMALLHGDPSKEGPFVLRLRFPANYQVPAHRHPGAEILTVISGTFSLGTGETADRSKVERMVAGSFTAMPPNMAHYAHTDEVTVVQINSMGPWSVTYVNQNEDPRRPQ